MMQHLTRSIRKNVIEISRTTNNNALRTYASSNLKLVRTSYIEDTIGVIYLSDPMRLNALTVSMGAQFMEAVEEMVKASNSQKIRACIITGDGNAFSAGGDLKWLRERHFNPSPYGNAKTMVDFYNRFLSVHRIPVPTISAINGAAVGAGLCLALATDIRVVAEKTKLGFTFAKLGIHPGMGSSFLLPRVLPSSEYASYLLLSGALIDGKTAAAKGLAMESVPTDDVMPRAIALAHELGSNTSPIAVTSCLQTIRNAKFDGLFQTALWREADCQAIAYTSKDFIRGLDAVEAKNSKIQWEGW